MMKTYKLTVWEKNGAIKTGTRQQQESDKSIELAPRQQHYRHHHHRQDISILRQRPIVIFAAKVEHEVPLGGRGRPAAHHPRCRRRHGG
ncbi:hypothetical protein O3P69_002529 [Scylla paramamosain]|uniref:Uncharacterized protein n=1 Tax=Scylla paramamosain TaxID=85552 RepID=A0AAW0UMR9_SCYPA